MLHVVLWKWMQRDFRCTYTDEHVNIVAQMVRSNVRRQAVKVHCITDQPHGIWEPTKVHELWKDFEDLPNITGHHLPSCYRRLKLFDIETQQNLGFAAGDHVVSLDLDSIVIKPFDDVLERFAQTDTSFGGWGVRGTYHQTVYNGSFWWFKAGDERLQYLWSTFEPVASPRKALTSGFLGSDQGWLSMHLTKDPRACPIRFPDFASYPREVKRTNILDKRTKIVFFHGSRKPWHAEEMRRQPWITKVWRIQP